MFSSSAFSSDAFSPSAFDLQAPPLTNANYMILSSVSLLPDDALYISNDLLLSLSLSDDLGAPITSGSIQVSIKDTSKSEVAGHAWPLQLQHQGAGVWSGVIDAGTQLEYGKKYTVEITASSSGLDGFFKKTYDAVFRGFG